MPHWRRMMDNKYLGAWDFEGGDKTATITNVEAGEVESKQGKAKKPLISFKGTDKKMVANATNCRTIEAMYGKNTDEWIGKDVTLYATTVDVGGQPVDAIRVRPQIPSKAGLKVAK